MFLLTKHFNLSHDLTFGMKFSLIGFLSIWFALAACGQAPVSSSPSIQTNSDVQKVMECIASKSKPLTWIFTGDSITHGAKHTHGSRSYVEHFAERMRWEMGRGNDIVINTGISGDKADGILRAFDWRVARFKPDVVSIMIGMNDCTRGAKKREEFRANLRELIHRVRGLGAIPVIHSSNIVEPSAVSERGDLPAYMSIVSEVAREERTIFVDHWHHWQASCTDEEKLKLWLNDPIHPNARGHRELAILTFKTLCIYDPKSPTCQATAP
jgi:lysophospholipase L1-like esterase